MNTRFVLAAGTTRTAAIDGISAAGANPGVLPYTPSIDAELLVYGTPVTVDEAPVSPSGCPTPGVITRAVYELLDLEVSVVDAGLAKPTAAPTVDVDASPGGDIRDADPVPNAQAVYDAAYEYAASLPDDHIVLAETIPGGTTTALGVLTVLDAARTVSSSLPENPLSLKRRVVDEALDGVMEPGAAGGGSIQAAPVLDAIEAVRHTGDPVLATAAGLAAGALDRDARVTLAGGTQQLAVAALCRANGYTDDLTVATTPYVANDETAAFPETAAQLDLDVTVTDPEFEDADHPGLGRYPAGEGKEGVGMGGALALADARGIDMATVREQAERVYERVMTE